MKKPNLDLLLHKWQRRLRLQDFDITARYASKQEMQNGDLGRNRLRWRLGLSDIVIINPAENDAVHPDFQNTELTLIHELMHLVLDPILSNKCYDADTLENALMEQTIEKLAKAVLEL